MSSIERLGKPYSSPTFTQTGNYQYLFIIYVKQNLILTIKRK